MNEIRLQTLFQFPCSDTVLSAIRDSIQVAESRNERLNTVHILYGLLSNRDSSACAALQVAGLKVSEMRKVILKLAVGMFPGPFCEETAVETVSDELEAALLEANKIAEKAFEQEIRTSDLLKALYVENTLSGDFLRKATSENQVMTILHKLESPA